MEAEHETQSIGEELRKALADPIMQRLIDLTTSKQLVWEIGPPFCGENMIPSLVGRFKDMRFELLPIEELNVAWVKLRLLIQKSIASEERFLITREVGFWTEHNEFISEKEKDLLYKLMTLVKDSPGSQSKKYNENKTKPLDSIEEIETILNRLQ